MPQAILQLVKSYYGEDSVKIEVIYNSDRIKILPETLKLLSGVKELKVTNAAKYLENYERILAKNKEDDDYDIYDDYDYNQDKKMRPLHPSNAICIF